MKKVTVKYLSLFSFLTVDLSYMIEVILLEYGDDVEIRLLAMSGEEAATCVSEVEGLHFKIAEERFWLFEHSAKTHFLHRRCDLEEKIIHLGKK